MEPKVTNISDYQCWIWLLLETILHPHCNIPPPKREGKLEKCQQIQGNKLKSLQDSFPPHSEFSMSLHAQKMWRLDQIYIKLEIKAINEYCTAEREMDLEYGDLDSATNKIYDLG